MKTIHLILISTLSLLAWYSVQAENTHIGLPATQHVTLELVSDNDSICTNDRSFFRLRAYGGRSDTPYQVPMGMDLIVTDVLWNAVGSPTTFTPGRLVTMRLDMYNPDGTYKISPFRATPVLVTPEHGTLIGGSDSIQSGVRFGQGKVLCAYAISESANSGAVNTVRRAIVHGYHVNR